MTMQLSEDIRNARLNQIEALIGPNAVLKIWSGVQPATVLGADAGVCLATVNLPTDWMLDAVGGQKAMSGTWSDNAADADGTAQHYRIYTSGGVCKLQGSVLLTGQVADMTLDSVTFKTGQQFTVTSYVWTEGNASA